jgi:hypothetical protein
VPVPLDELEPDVLPLPDGDVVLGELDGDEAEPLPLTEPLPVAEPLGDVVVGGEADGVPPGRSPTRSVRDSEHAVARPATSASAANPVSTFFIGILLGGVPPWVP